METTTTLRRSTYVPLPDEEVGRSFEREYQESVSVFRGLIYASLFSLPILALISGGVVWLVTR
jgi:hypothetical protein